MASSSSSVILSASTGEVVFSLKRALDDRVFAAPKRRSSGESSPQEHVNDELFQYVKSEGSVREARTAVLDYLIGAVKADCRELLRSESAYEDNLYIGLHGGVRFVLRRVGRQDWAVFQGSSKIAEDRVRETLLASSALLTPLVFGARFSAETTHEFRSDYTADDMEEFLYNTIDWGVDGESVVLTEYSPLTTEEELAAAHPVAAALARADHPAYYEDFEEEEDDVFGRRFFLALVPRLNECQL